MVDALSNNQCKKLSSWFGIKPRIAKQTFSADTILHIAQKNYNKAKLAIEIIKSVSESNQCTLDYDANKKAIYLKFTQHTQEIELKQKMDYLRTEIKKAHRHLYTLKEQHQHLTNQVRTKTIELHAIETNIICRKDHDQMMRVPATQHIKRDNTDNTHHSKKRSIYRRKKRSIYSMSCASDSGQSASDSGPPPLISRPKTHHYNHNENRGHKQSREPHLEPGAYNKYAEPGAMGHGMHTDMDSSSSSGTEFVYNGWNPGMMPYKVCAPKSKRRKT
eukprot:11139_1